MTFGCLVGMQRSDGVQQHHYLVGQSPVGEHRDKSLYRSKLKCSKEPMDTMRSTGSSKCSRPSNSTRCARVLDVVSNSCSTWACWFW